jgi:hypothetical protein
MQGFSESSMATPNQLRFNRSLLEESLANLDSPQSEHMVTPPKAIAMWNENAYKQGANALILPPQSPHRPLEQKWEVERLALVPYPEGMAMMEVEQHLAIVPDHLPLEWQQQLQQHPTYDEVWQHTQGMIRPMQENIQFLLHTLKG